MLTRDLTLLSILSLPQILILWGLTVCGLRGLPLKYYCVKLQVIPVKMYHFCLGTVNLNLQPVTDSVGKTVYLLVLLGFNEVRSMGIRK